MIPQFNDDHSITMLHGTTAANAASIRATGFKPSEPARIAAMVEREYGLEKDSILTHEWYRFPMGRCDLDHVHFTSNLDTASKYYTVPEQLRDALTTAYRIMHPEMEAMSWAEAGCPMKAWVETEAKRLVQPEVLVVKIPWSSVKFGRTLAFEEAKRIFADDLPHAFAIPVADLATVEILGSL